MGEYKGRIDVGLGIIANIDIKAPKFIQFICNKWGLNKCIDTLNRHERIILLHLFGILLLLWFNFKSFMYLFYFVLFASPGYVDLKGWHFMGSLATVPNVR